MIMDSWEQSRLTRDEVKERREVAHRVHDTLSEHERYADCKLVIFGSSANGLASDEGDLDLNLECNELNIILGMYDQRTRRRHIRSHIDRIANLLRQDGFANVVPISRARVPLVKFLDPCTHIECDLTITNRIAQRKTQLLAAYVKADPRVGPLLFAVKRWAKARKINDAAAQGGSTINSYTHTLMMLAYLQRAKVIPLLQYICCAGPPASTYTRMYEAMYDNIDDSPENRLMKGLVRRMMELSMNEDSSNSSSNGSNGTHPAYADGQTLTNAYPQRVCRVCKTPLPSHVVEGCETYFYTGAVPPSPNKQDVSQLLIGFFRFYALVFKANEECVSPRLGGMVLRSAKRWEHQAGSAVARRNGELPAFCVEDLFELLHNCAGSAQPTFWPGLRWEYERALRALLFVDDVDEMYRQWKKMPAAAYGALGIW
ncbi:hypothetical protein SYNPS1DRAFT_27163 [Syncephalis pseudoplumigaleata]|uniref:polynucleotide adenylyltransferase n=1 Tax=Syncephalis pseudoplumigaleata TaxID=1712513 RepID=A0A4P9Z5T5_9FUNG|nr:hypothetical protein SYNPS1DRAFT_27163 [Syncephalis pseudoplumigaleata]|eukprot:RKP27171.1 hypothetical protein SYNPS1DRAFT_27163 [Syncephalis pseudoplumigaleata]